MKKILIGLAALMLPMMSMASLASVITFDEGVTIQSGTLFYDGLGGSLYGNDIDFTTSTGVDTVINQGAANSLECISCLLNFQTGANIQEGPAIWQWAGGGSFSLTGTLMDGFTEVATGTLLDGMFSGNPGAIGDGQTILFSGAGELDLLSDISDYFGVGSEGHAFANTELALGSCSPTQTTATPPFPIPPGAIGTASVDVGSGSGGFFCNLHNADLAINATQVPVPGTLVLMGFGLLFMRHQVKKNPNWLA